MTRVEQLELIKEIFTRLNSVSGNTIEEMLDNAIHNIDVDIEIEKYGRSRWV